MKRAIGLLLFCAFFIVGCGRTQVEEVHEIIVPTNVEVQTLRLDYVNDPNSAKGQKMLRKMRNDRRELDEAKREWQEIREKMKG